MSTENLWQICHKKRFDNSMLTAIIAAILRESGLTTKQVAAALDISTERVRHWYYRDTGMGALDFLKMMHQYKICSHLPVFLKNPECACCNPQQELAQREFMEQPDIGMITLRSPRLEQIAVTLECQAADLFKGFSRIPL